MPPHTRRTGRYRQYRLFHPIDLLGTPSTGLEVTLSWRDLFLINFNFKPFELMGKNLMAEWNVPGEAAESLHVGPGSE